MKKRTASTAERPEGARIAHAENSKRIKDVEAARTAALVADDDREVDRLLRSAWNVVDVAYAGTGLHGSRKGSTGTKVSRVRPQRLGRLSR
jgi:hypothetical protein